MPDQSLARSRLRFARLNYVLLAAGFVSLVLGYWLLSRGSTTTAPAPPTSLLGQLATGGRLVAPIAQDLADMLTLFTRQTPSADPRTLTGFERTAIAPARFVPLIGDEGFAE